jgi:D-threo-aldose 1-dehydrogenase
MAIRLDELRRVGNSDVAVSPLGFGGNVLGNLYATVEEDAALDTVAAAFESGIRLFDTAPLYGHGLSEHRMGNALRRYPRDAFVLSSKVGRLLKPHGKVPPPKLDPSQGGIFTGELPFQPVFDYTYEGTIRSVEDSLQRLGMNRIDMVLIHDADMWTHGDQYEARLEDVRTGALPALRKLKEDGVIRAYGAGVNQAEACERLMDIGRFDAFLLAGRYTLLEQGGLDSFLPRCVAENVSIILARLCAFFGWIKRESRRTGLKRYSRGRGRASWWGRRTVHWRPIFRGARPARGPCRPRRSV